MPDIGDHDGLPGHGIDDAQGCDDRAAIAVKMAGQGASELRVVSQGLEALQDLGQKRARYGRQVGLGLR